MANVAISNLLPAGNDLFLDSESFLNNLTDEQSVQVFGGRLKITGLVIIDWSWRVKIDIDLSVK
jgi:hypothetical protein